MIVDLWISPSNKKPPRNGFFEVIVNVMGEDGTVFKRQAKDFWDGRFRYFDDDVVAWREIRGGN